MIVGFFPAKAGRRLTPIRNAPFQGAFLFYPFSPPLIPSLSPPPPPAHAAHPRAHAARIHHRRRSGLRFRRGFEGASRSDRAARARLAPCFWFALICGWLRAPRPNRGEASAANRRQPYKNRGGSAAKPDHANPAASRRTASAARAHWRCVCRTIKRRCRQAEIRLCATARNETKCIGKGGEGESIGAGPNDSIVQAVRFEKRK